MYINKYFYLHYFITMFRKILYMIAFAILYIATPIYASNISLSDTSGFLEYENDLFIQGEILLDEYNQENNTNFTSSDIDQLPKILNVLVSEDRIQEARIIDEYFLLSNQVSIYDLFAPEQNFPTFEQSQTQLETQNMFSPLANYNRNSAKNYAYNWVYQRNPAYDYYAQFGWSNNGQNFVSQVLAAGGVTHLCTKNDINLFDSSCWYYSNTWYARPTHTW